MTGSFVDKLLISFDKLENCIAVTESVLKQKPEVPDDVLKRITQYSEIVSKQRRLAEELRGYLADQNWDQVSRHIKLINGLSSMIRDDAQQILATNGEFLGEQHSQQHFC
ncbi:MAG: hypothetical protein KDD66_13340 [Bdellovibrionales bacterium]|nr:hypothetical protein [Bdellovibrionales bacterium]